ncbi:MAG: phosphatidylglycerophosphatase A [Bdellovibrionaceae bacterium]|nr:phosphatidylglycerophosphatase A [Bdellovibrionales bacterium]MCB9084896.1 phosphatidylglycerophosphatase A [Pseudobdellovibrionaceae bacterium]
MGFLFDTGPNQTNDGPLVLRGDKALDQSRWVSLLATAGGLGKAPKAPGTVGTLAALPLVPLFAWGGEYFYMLATAILVVVAIVVAQMYETQHGDHDPKEVVIDEVAGFVVAMLWLPLTWQSFVAAFAIFRLLDAVKPFPISVVDRKVQGGLGVVADDLVAGILTNVLLQIAYTKTDWLGQQLVL